VDFTNEKSHWFFNSRTIIKEQRVEGEKPAVQSEEEGYKIQSEVLRALNWKVGGWKLGGTTLLTQEMFNCDRVYFGPLEQEKIIKAAEFKPCVFTAPKKLKGEPEVAFLLNENIANLSYLGQHNDVFKYVDYFATAFECPMEGCSQTDYINLGDLLADLCGSGYLIVGEPIEVNELPAFLSSEVRVTQNCKVIQKGSSRVIVGTPLKAVFDFLNLTLSLGIQLEVGQWVATGGCAPCCDIDPFSSVTVSFDAGKPFKFLYNST